MPCVVVWALHRSISSILKNSSKKIKTTTTIPPFNKNQNHPAGRLWMILPHHNDEDSHEDHHATTTTTTTSSGSMADSSSNNGTDSQQVFLVQLPNKSSAGAGDRWLWWRRKKGSRKDIGEMYRASPRPLTWIKSPCHFHTQRWQIIPPSTASSSSSTTTFKTPAKSKKRCIGIGWRLVSASKWKAIRSTKKKQKVLIIYTHTNPHLWTSNHHRRM